MLRWLRVCFVARRICPPYTYGDFSWQSWCVRLREEHSEGLPKLRNHITHDELVDFFQPGGLHEYGVLSGAEFDVRIRIVVDINDRPVYRETELYVVVASVERMPGTSREGRTCDVKGVLVYSDPMMLVDNVKLVELPERVVFGVAVG